MLKTSLTAVAVLSLLLIPFGCESTQERADTSEPPPTYRGPEFLRGTVGSVASVQGYEPVLVSGYGLLVNLDGTGSADAPPALRQWLLDEMAKRGFGSYETGYEHLRPEEVFADDSTAVVLIEGIIPPGAPKGTRFDLVVSALPATQTTSVRGGTLYTSDLTVGGRRFSPTSVNALARGRGQVFSSPFSSRSEAEIDPDTDVEGSEDPRMGRILAGGVNVVDMPLQLVTTRPSYVLTRRIADRINGAYPPGPDEDEPIAVPQNDTVIRINVTEQFKDDPREMLEIITHLDLNPTQEHAKQRTRELAEMLADDENADYFENVVYSWKGMGQPIVEELRKLYEHESERVRLAALSAGTYLRDTRAASALMELAEADVEEDGANDPVRATELLGDLLEQRSDFTRVAAFLQEQLDHDEPLVRVAAYEALTKVEHPAVQRFGFKQKMELAHGRSERPMVHLTQRGVPRVIVFGSRVEMEQPLFFSAWDNRFMLRADEDAEEIAVFYQPEGRSAIRTTVPNNLVHLVGAMAYQPGEDAETVGLDMSYSEIVEILYRLHDEGLLDAPLMLQETDYTQRVIASRDTEGDTELRPETGGESESGQGHDIQGLDGDLTPAILTDEENDSEADAEDDEPVPAEFEQQ